jgi:hypothetical protein
MQFTRFCLLAFATVFGIAQASPEVQGSLCCTRWLRIGTVARSIETEGRSLVERTTRRRLMDFNQPLTGFTSIPAGSLSDQFWFAEVGLALHHGDVLGPNIYSKQWQDNGICYNAGDLVQWTKPGSQGNSRYF